MDVFSQQPTNTRRQFVSCLSFAALGGAAAQASTKSPYQAVAFDGFPIFDARPVFALTEELFPGKGGELSNAWRTRQFEYQWLRTLSHQYSDFWSITADSLTFAAKSLQLDLTADKRTRLMDSYLAFKCWPDVPEGLDALRRAGLRTAFLSNLTEKIILAGLKNSGLEGRFDYILSADRVKAFKPDPRAYRMGLDAFRLKRRQIVFAASSGWDAAGAKTFGYPTVWVNRQNQPVEELGVTPDAIGANLHDPAAYATGGSLIKT